jgi:hypothetical protein
MMDPQVVDLILTYACRAPSVHNTQPWTWRVREDRVDLYADVARQLVHTDPQRRDLMLSCGAALHHFQVAAAAMGWRARVRRCPDPGETRFVASATLTPQARPADADQLLQAILRRRTDRRRLSAWPVPAERLTALAATGTRWGAHVVPIHDEATMARLDSLTTRADEVQRADGQYLRELTASTTYWDAHGVPVGHIPRSGTAAGGAAGGRRRFPHGVLDDGVEGPEPPPDGMLLITSSSDDPMSRVRAGEALSAVWLDATRGGLSVVPLSQALEVDETRHALQGEVLDDLAVAQLVLRIGWLPSDLDELPPTPRRRLAEVRIH